MGGRRADPVRRAGAAIRILEALGQPAARAGRARGRALAAGVGAAHYIVGVGGQNAANAQQAQANGLVRGDFLDSVARAWEHLPAQDWPFVNAMAGQFAAHDDRGDFLAGIDLLLGGLKAPRRR